ncbi:MAG: nuclear transport factor 2 family protein [Hyphomonadaceae bacterium]
MSVVLPPPIEAYFAAKNRHDIEAMLAPFASDAVVHDEDETHTGREPIRAWMEATTRKYRVTSEPQSADADGDSVLVRSRVSGNFPGSPATLAYRFTLDGAQIKALRIGA